MRKSRFLEEQVIAILGEHERGMTTVEVCRRHGISQNTFYKWKAKFGGMDVSDARKLKTLEQNEGSTNGALAKPETLRYSTVGLSKRPRDPKGAGQCLPSAPVKQIGHIGQERCGHRAALPPSWRRSTA